MFKTRPNVTLFFLSVWKCTLLCLFVFERSSCGNTALLLFYRETSTLWHRWSLDLFTLEERPDLWEDLRWDSLLIVTALKSVKTWGQRREADVTVQESPAVCSASPSEDLSAEKFGQTMWVDRAWNYYHHQFWMKKRKHIFHRKGGSFQFSCVVRTTRTIPQMISSTSKEFTFRGGNVPLLCPYTGFSQPKRRIVCLVSLFIIPSVHTTIVLNK